MRIPLLFVAAALAALPLAARCDSPARSLHEIAAALKMTQIELLTAGASGALDPKLQAEFDRALRAQLSGGGALIAQPQDAQEG